MYISTLKNVKRGRSKHAGMRNQKISHPEILNLKGGLFEKPYCLCLYEISNSCQGLFLKMIAQHWISLPAFNWQHVLLWLGGIHAISGHFKTAPSQWIPSISPRSFLIPGDWNICQDDWTSIECYSGERGSEGERRRGCRSRQQWWLRDSQNLIKMWWVSLSSQHLCVTRMRDTQTSYNT